MKEKKSSGRAKTSSIENSVSEGARSRRFEVISGITIAFFAAILAINELGSGKFGDDEIIAHNEKTTAYAWYNSKGLKQNLAEGQRDTLKSFIDAGIISKNHAGAVKTVVTKLDQDISRYGKEKKEILLGSSKVGKTNWVQEVDGELGKVIGAKEWESNAEALGKIGDIYDFATLFLQFCIVLGAISLVLHIEKMKWFFYCTMVLLGTAGMVISAVAFIKAFSLPILG